MPNTWLSNSLWPAIRIKYICSECFSGGTPDTTNSSYWNNGTIPWIASGELQNCDVNNATNYITIKGLSNSSARLIRKDSVAVAMTGATCANVGYINFDTSANQSVYAYVMKGNQNARFAYYSLIAMRDEILSKQNGGAQAGINGVVCKNLYIPKLDLQKQQQIVNYLDKKVGIIDKLIENIKQQIEDLKQCKMNLITETVTKGLNKNAKLKTIGLKWCNNIAEDFGIGIIRADFTLRGRIGWQGLTTNDYVEEGPYLITGTDFENEQINWDTCVHITDKRYDEDANIHVRENDLLITKDGTVGKLAIVKNSPKKVSLNSGIMLIKSRTNRCLTSYLKYVLSSSVFWDWYYFSQRGKATIQHLYQEQFSYFKYPLPDIITQQHIMAYLDKKCDTINRLLQNKRQKIEELTRYKKSLIYECVTGKKEVL